ncbi:Tryptophan--tRNA ligase, mitochondrial [Candida viswanathii]|uniref:Tryptophan--tRNA ligase, mitochondrial n=1 Tax=Candida viswanathii TaxID=5486 RepID=A0A367YIK6_9ASCO|nr:Tryptophan--tRNA ligase, mitochondrial [Candida viswanathii]
MKNENPQKFDQSTYSTSHNNHPFMSTRAIPVLRISRRTLSTASTAAKGTVQEVKQSNATLPSNSTIFSLIQPTGKIHLGNYLGAVKSWRTLSESNTDPTNKFIYGIADLHAITIPKNPTDLKTYRYNAIASLLASGLDALKCILFFQSSVPEHAELNWFLTCLTSMGALNRMTQWKLKAQQLESSSILEDNVLEKTKAGLFCYPALQAADILLYKSTHVPVGDDQSQHLELCRNVARTFNSTFNTDYFPLPTTLLTPAKKVLSLRDPAKKMSKSDPVAKSCVYVTDSPSEIELKIRKATTDSIQGPIYYDPIERPGVSNLINIVSGLTNTSIEEVVASLSHVTSHKQLKDYVSAVIIEEFDPKRQLYEQLMQDRSYLEQICLQGRDTAREIALANLQEVKVIMGLD